MKKSVIILLSFLIPYFIVFFIPLITLDYVYKATIKTVEQELIDKNISLLNKSKAIIDRHLEEIDAMIGQIEDIAGVKSFSRETDPFSASNVVQLMDIRKNMIKYDRNYDFIFDYFIVFKNSRLILGQETTYRLDKFYSQYFKYKSIEYDQWLKEWLDTYKVTTYFPMRQIMLNGKAFSAITAVKSIWEYKYYDSSIIVLINNYEFQKLLSGMDLSGHGFAYILDNHGNILCASPDIPDFYAEDIQLKGVEGSMQQYINNEKMLITHTTSNLNGWQYVVVQPDNIVMKKVSEIKNSITLVSSLTIIFAVFIIFVMAYRISKPLRRLVNTVLEKMSQEGRISGGIYKFLQNAFLYIINSNEVLREEIDKSEPLLKAAFIEKIFNGSFMKKEDANAFMSYLKMDINAKFHTVAILHLFTYDKIFSDEVLKDASLKKLVFLDRLKSHLKGKMLSQDMDTDKIAFLISSDSEDMGSHKKYIMDLLEQLTGSLSEFQNFTASFFIGGTYDNLLSISISKVEAYECMNYCGTEASSGSIVWYRDISKASKGYYYPHEVETRLMNVTLSGDREEAEKIIHTIYEENINIRDLSPVMLRLFNYEMCATLTKLLGNEALDKKNEVFNKLCDLLNHINNSNSIYSIKKMIIDIYKDICHDIDQKLNLQSSDLVKKVVDYMNSNYSDFTLSLVSIAGKFNLSQVYLSKLFKEQTGDTIFGYLEKIRLQYACELLLNKKYPVKTIAEKVGYCSSNTFCRSFKRYFGVSTTEYLNMVRLTAKD